MYYDDDLVFQHFLDHSGLLHTPDSSSYGEELWESSLRVDIRIPLYWFTLPLSLSLGSDTESRTRSPMHLNEFSDSL